MKQIGAFEARTHFSEILTYVANGEKFVITKHGTQIAMIIPFEPQNKGVDPIADAIRTIQKLSKGIKLGKDVSIRQMREEGRK